MTAAAAAAAAVLALGALWQPVRPGVWLREETMAASGPLAAVRVVALRLDPARLAFALDTATRDDGLRGGWTIERLGPTGVVAFNAGQFTGGSPWGWLVHEGRELQPPGVGPLSMAFVVDDSGAVSLTSPQELPAVRARARTAFQSYPTLLDGGEPPWPLQGEGRGVDLVHRDARLALGVLDDGTIVVALTRFGPLGRAGETLPWGPTVPEMAAFMKSLGCRRAVLLDGGLSSQLVLRRSDDALSRWSNWRQVPLGLIVTPRTPPGIR